MYSPTTANTLETISNAGFGAVIVLLTKCVRYFEVAHSHNSYHASINRQENFSLKLVKSFARKKGKKHTSVTDRQTEMETNQVPASYLSNSPNNSHLFMYIK